MTDTFPDTRALHSLNETVVGPEQGGVRRGRKCGRGSYAFGWENGVTDGNGRAGGGGVRDNKLGGQGGTLSVSQYCTVPW